MRRKQEPLGLTQTILLALLVAFAGTTFYFALNYLALREQGVSKGSATVNISGSIPALPQDFPESLDQTVALGKDIFMNTKDHPLSKAYVGNALSCTSCHLNGGTDPKGLTLVALPPPSPPTPPGKRRSSPCKTALGTALCGASMVPFPH